MEADAGTRAETVAGAGTTPKLGPRSQLGLILRMDLKTKQGMTPAVGRNLTATRPRKARGFAAAGKFGLRGEVSLSIACKVCVYFKHGTPVRTWALQSNWVHPLRALDWFELIAKHCMEALTLGGTQARRIVRVRWEPMFLERATPVQMPAKAWRRPSPALPANCVRPIATCHTENAAGCWVTGSYDFVGALRGACPSIEPVRST